MCQNLNNSRCAKQITIAIIENKGSYWVGSNWCEKPQKKCPRGNLPSGVGYDMCKDICKQLSHAEVDAIKNAGLKAKGGKLYLIGHTYICDDCMKAIKKAGIKQTVICGDLWSKKGR